MQGNSLFFSLEPHVVFMCPVLWNLAISWYPEQFVFRWLRVCALCQRRSFSRGFHVPFFLKQSSCSGSLHGAEQTAGQRLLFCAALGGCFCPFPRRLKIERVLQIRLLALPYFSLHLSRATSKVAPSDSPTLLQFPPGASCWLFIPDVLLARFSKPGKLPPGNLAVNHHILLCFFMLLVWLVLASFFPSSFNCSCLHAAWLQVVLNGFRRIFGFWAITEVISEWKITSGTKMKCFPLYFIESL